MTDEQHKEAVLAAKRVRAYIIAHPGCSSREVVRATGFDPGALKLLVGRASSRKRRDGVIVWTATPEAKEVRRASEAVVAEHIDRGVAAVQRGHGGDVETSTPLSELLAKEADQCIDNQLFDEIMRELGMEGRAQMEGLRPVREVQAELLGWFLRWLFERGVDPRVVVQRVFSAAKEFSPGVLNGMSDEAISVLTLDGGRAAVNARTQLIAKGLKAATGLRTHVGMHHKAKRSA